MIIDVSSPTFSIDEDNPTKVDYTYETGRPVVVGLFPFGLIPKLEFGDILYRYKNGRGFILKSTNSVKFEECKMGDNTIVHVKYKGEDDPVLEIDKFINEKYGDKTYKEFVDSNMDNPWERIIIFK